MEKKLLQPSSYSGNDIAERGSTVLRYARFTSPLRLMLITGDGSSLNVNTVVTTVNAYGDWVIASVTLEHTYAAPNNKGTPYTVTFSGSARIDTLNNNAGKNWFLTTTLDCNLVSSPRSKVKSTIILIK